MNNDVLLVSCTRGPKENTELFRSLSSLGLPVDVLFFENNNEGLSSRYNLVLDQLAGSDRLVAFVHDDVRINDPEITSKLRHGLRANAVLGVAGSGAFTADPGDGLFVAWFSGHREMWSGHVFHKLPTKLHHTIYGPVPRRCVVLDGVFLAVDLRQLNGVRFDPRFSFHFYDLDFCLTALRAGLKLSTIEIGITHYSGGEVTVDNHAFMAQQRAFVAKWDRKTFTV
jgi:hypothetical protein